MSSGPALTNFRAGTLLATLALLWIVGIVLRAIGVAFESTVASHIASMVLFTPFISICVLAALAQNPDKFRVSSFVIGAAVTVVSFLIWNGTMLGITRIATLDLVFTIQRNAIHWIVFFCVTTLSLKCTQWALPIGLRSDVQWSPGQWTISDLLFVTLVTAILFATLGLALRSQDSDLAFTSVASAVRGGIFLSLFIASLIMSSQSRQNRVAMLVGLLLVCTAIRYITPWLDQRLASAFAKQPIIPLVTINPWVRSPLASFLESIAQVGLLVIMLDTLKLSRVRRHRDEEADCQLD